MISLGVFNVALWSRSDLSSGTGSSHQLSEQADVHIVSQWLEASIPGDRAAKRGDLEIRCKEVEDGSRAVDLLDRVSR